MHGCMFFALLLFLSWSSTTQQTRLTSVNKSNPSSEPLFSAKFEKFSRRRIMEDNENIAKQQTTTKHKTLHETMVALQDELLKVLLPHFEESQQQGQEERKYELSLEASVTQLKTKIAALEMEAGVDRLTLDNNNNEEEEELSPLEVYLGDILVSFVDAAVSTDATSDLQESIDRVLALVAGLAVAYSSEVTSMVLVRAVEFSTVLLERVRGHACVLLGKLVASMKNSGQQEDEDTEANLNQLLDTLLPRLQDKSQAVRCHAIKAVGCFFTTTKDIETYDEALEALLWNLAHDPSVSNRITAVQVIPVHPNTLDSLTGRVRDVKAKVRSEALEVLRSKASVKDMNEGQMVELIRSGLTNR